jgi:hypothetical protein
MGHGFSEDWTKNPSMNGTIITPMDRRGTQNYLQAVVEASKNPEKSVVLFSPMARL